MDTVFPDILRSLIARYGTSVIETPGRVEALLKDLTKGEHRREVNLALSALREGVPAAMLNGSEAGHGDILMSRLAAGLVDDLSLTQESARWAVGVWAVALGLAEQVVVAPQPRSQPSVPPVSVQPTNSAESANHSTLPEPQEQSGQRQLRQLGMPVRQRTASVGPVSSQSPRDILRTSSEKLGTVGSCVGAIVGFVAGLSLGGVGCIPGALIGFLIGGLGGVTLPYILTVATASVIGSFLGLVTGSPELAVVGALGGMAVAIVWLVYPIFKSGDDEG